MYKDFLAHLAVVIGFVMPVVAVMYGMILWVSPLPLGLLAAMILGYVMVIWALYAQDKFLQILWVVVALGASIAVFHWWAGLVVLGLAIDHFGYDMLWWRLT